MSREPGSTELLYELRKAQRSNPSMEKMKQQKQKKSINEKLSNPSMDKKNKSIHDILPLDLIHRILLRVPAKHLAPLRCVSKLWHSLISDPDFAELHFHHSPASTNAWVFIEKGSVAYFVYLDSLFTDNNDALQVKKVSPSFEMKSPPQFEVLGSCRGFVLLHRQRSLLVLWNPLTGSSKRICYSRILSRCKHRGSKIPCEFHVYGVGYDASRDDYLVVVAWQDKHDQDHFHCFSLRTNSWIDFDAALPKPLGFNNWHSRGLFFNGAIHLVPCNLKDYRDAILIFDLKERTFSMISAPEQPGTGSRHCTGLARLGGCLALYYRSFDSFSTHIWVMKEYKVHSSWTLYKIPLFGFRPLCLSSDMDLVGRGYSYTCDKSGFYIYNIGEERLQRVKNLCFSTALETDAVYTESLLPLPSEIKDKDKKKEIGHQVLHECFEQLDVAKG